MKNQIAVITGAGSGIGKAIAMECSRNYGKLHLVGRSRRKLESVAGIARRNGCEVKTHSVDLASCDEIKKFYSHVGNEEKQIDLLVHSAGIFFSGSIENASIKHFDQLYYTNVRGPYYLTQLFLTMLRRSQGQIVFINSSVGLGGSPKNVSQYSAMKQALKAVTDILREEVNEEGIRVINIFPGRTATSMQKAICKAEGMLYVKSDHSQPEDIAKVLMSALRLSKTSEIKDIVIRPMKKLKLSKTSLYQWACAVSFACQDIFGSIDFFACPLWV